MIPTPATIVKANDCVPDCAAGQQNTLWRLVCVISHSSSLGHDRMGSILLSQGRASSIGD
jgi:hypothetical protein